MMNYYGMTKAAANVGAITTAGGIDSALFSRWLSFVDASKKTIATYTRAIRQFMFWLSSNGVTEPTRESVLAYRESLRNEGLKPATINAYLIAVKLFFKWTASEGIYKNIAERVKGERLESGHKKDPLTAAQARDLLTSIERDTMKGARDYALISLLLSTGLRTIEINRAKVGDLRTLGNDSVLFIQGKGRTEKTEYVKIPSQVEKALREYLARRNATDPNAPLFASLDHKSAGGAMDTRSVSRAVKEHLDAAGLISDRLTAHSLRHTAATLNLLNGGSLEETKQLLRHKNINTTLIYAHAIERANNNSEQRVANAIFG